MATTKTVYTQNTVIQEFQLYELEKCNKINQRKLVDYEKQNNIKQGKMHM